MHYSQFITYFIPLILFHSVDSTDIRQNVSSKPIDDTENPNSAPGKIAKCTLDGGSNNEAASSNVQAVYETTTTPPEDAIEASTENPAEKVPSWKIKRSRKKWKPETTAQTPDLQEAKVTQPHNGTFSINLTDWTQRIFERGHKLAKRKEEEQVAESTTENKPLINDNVTTERTRTRYGWRIRKRNRKVLSDGEQAESVTGEPRTAAEDPIVHQTVLELNTENPNNLGGPEDFAKRINIARRKYSARFRNLPNVTTTDATPQASEHEEMAEPGNKNESSGVEHPEEVSEESNNGLEAAEQKYRGDKKEDGSGGQKGSEHHSEHNEKGSKGYESHEKDEKVNKGHKDSESHEGEYENDKSSKAEHHNEDGHYQSEDEEEGGKKGAEHEEHEHYKKGHSTHGGHVIHKKDEYEKKTEFFDEDDDDGHGEKFGEYHEEHGGEKGGHHKKGHYDSALDEEHKEEEGKHEKKTHHAHDKGHERKEGDEKFYEHDESYGKKASHGHQTQFNHPGKMNGHLIRGAGQAAIQTPQNYIPMQRREEHEENTQYEEEGSDRGDAAGYIEGEESNEDDGHVRGNEDEQEQYQDEDDEGNHENSKDSQDESELMEQRQKLVNAMLQKYPHAQFLDHDGPTEQAKSQQHQAFIPFRQAYQMTYKPPTTTPFIKQDYRKNERSTESPQRQTTIRFLGGFVPNTAADFIRPEATPQPYHRVKPYRIPIPIKSEALRLPDRTSFEVLDMHGSKGISKPIGFPISAEISQLPSLRNRRYPAHSSNSDKMDYQVNTAYYPVSITTGPM